MTEIMSAKTVGYSDLAYRHGMLFAIVRQPPKQQPFLAIIASLVAPEERKALVDPNEMDQTGATSIDRYIPSPDGSLVAVSLSNGGTESGDVHLFETATGRQVHEVVPRGNSGTAGGDLAWTADAAGFYYTRHLPGDDRSPEDINLRQQVYFHKRGMPVEADRYELGKGFPAVAEIEFEMHEPSGTLLATVQNGDGGEFAHYLRLLTPQQRGAGDTGQRRRAADLQGDGRCDGHAAPILGSSCIIRGPFARVFKQSAKRILDHVPPRQSVEPLPGDPALTPTGSGKLPTNRSGRVGVITEIHSPQNGLAEVFGIMEGPQRRVEAVYNVAAADDLGWLAAAEAACRDGLDLRMQRFQGPQAFQGHPGRGQHFVASWLLIRPASTRAR